MMMLRVFLLICACASVLAMPSAFSKVKYNFHLQLPDQSLENEVHSYNFPFVTREQWQARPPVKKTPLQTPVPFVVIHHSYIPAACYDKEQCCAAMRSMQNFHIDDRGWWDIGYSFAVGSDGAAYEGRGWETLGAHALHFNTVSIGICLIGDWRFEVPPAEQRKTAMALIAAGVELGFIKPDYKLVGHRQVRATECPGDALFNEIKTWDHYSPFPNSHLDLLSVEEIPDFVKEAIRNNGTLPV
ncbi:peptidoglycan-recognition protein LB-like isoform X1 [Helicoverpa zea]|uniref:peptidoglycan-recognition protein LB-like isoform X1 n=1 Tax=Helicoverpa zea TaxID=7113 RepID=UPI001F57AB69|nr:peptidoglycan-recognition protein LB-like isoform X1 [Helicoverpa zea]XP_047032980.1 peptidoglycan-recognition protein LB-like isoform X1 [Helicoverpa zea]